ncbi:lactate utilization protein B/C [Lacihabitans sp. LS3-19]|uniref:LutC/YkgG family protein n=1 Tax=Lacihabitans sp. LS3-19 TaxID=2487335 RepID=UPI0020CC3AD4|nr:LUD domain-containing protein [Lacihabitans sp. LS3-19]MCP9769647.1 lactate utilization protein B/C [Lacihabitans sp. LS3-19]
MSSRDNILSKIKQNQPDLLPLPNLSVLGGEQFDLVEKFTEILEGIGGKVIQVAHNDEIKKYIAANYPPNARVISTLSEFSENKDWQLADPHTLKDADFLIIKGQFAVAENGAIWLTETEMGQRVAPFITQYLAIIIDKSTILPTMHQAYEHIGSVDYGFGVFLAGPSKTADIEQSLVLGAHGARGLVVFLV